MKDTHKLIAWIAGAFLLVGVMVLLSFQTYLQIKTSAAARGVAFESIIRTDKLLGDLVDAETAQRGFLVTGDEAFLQPYLAVNEGIRARLGGLRSAASSSDALKHLDSLTTLVEAKLAQIEESIEMRRHGDAAGALAVLSGGQGRQMMDSIRADFAGLIEPEKRLVERHDAGLQASLQRLFGVMVTASLFTLLFALLFLFLIYREARNRIASAVQLETQRLLAVQEGLNRDLQQANATLQVNEEKLAVTLNSIGDAVITTDDQGRVTLLNPLAERLTGWTRANAAGRPVEQIFNIINQDTRQPSVVPVMDTLAKGTQHGLANHTILIALDGSEFTIADSCAPIRDRGGQVVGAVLVFRDVTHEDEARQALRDQQFYTRSLIESNIDALVATNPTGIITDANKQMEQLTGCTRDELIGAPFGKCFTDPARAEAGIKQVLREKKVRDYELTARARDGRETAVSFNATTFADRQRVQQGVFAAARDVTERKRLDQVLQEKNTELELARTLADKANLAKSDFLSSMSHELRTPLNAILGFAQLMDSATPAPAAAEKRNIARILKAGWFLLELVNEILDLAQIESGKATLSGEPVALNEVMQECQAMFEPQAEQRGVRMVFPDSRLGYFVKADRTRVKQILINLLFNAIKYNRTDGTVVVEYIPSPPESVRISVRDTGAGLAPEQLAQLFQPFNRLGRESGAEEGTGIGLVVTKRLVELMGGRIGVESTVGTGSTFWIELELSAPPKLAIPPALTAAPALPASPAGTPKRTVLYVEDNSANLELVEQLIARRPDLHLLSAVDGELGIALARAWLPEVILMDINLPGIDGYEALTILHLDPATAHIPVIALSANAMPRDVEKGRAAGFFSYLTKPINVIEFMAALDSALIAAQAVLERRKQTAPA